MSMGEVIEFIERFAIGSGAPVRTGTDVTSVRHADDGYLVTTNHGEIRAQTVVIASGACNRPTVPSFSAMRCRRRVEQLTPFDYRDPAQLADGGVLVVGASATGVQLAAELHRSGPAGDAVGRRACAVAAHLPGPRRALVDGRVRRMGPALRRGRRPDPGAAAALAATRRHARSRHVRSQRARPRWASSWSAAWRRCGTGARCSPAGCATCSSLADLKMERLLDTFDEWAASARSSRSARRSGSRRPASRSRHGCSSTWRSGEIRTIVWATGFRPEYGWLDVPVVDPKGRLRHDGGVVDSPGLYALGLPVLRRRKSTFIHGIEDDAREVIDHLAKYLASRR